MENKKDYSTPSVLTKAAKTTEQKKLFSPFSPCGIENREEQKCVKHVTCMFDCIEYEASVCSCCTYGCTSVCFVLTCTINDVSFIFYCILLLYSVKSILTPKRRLSLNLDESMQSPLSECSTGNVCPYIDSSLVYNIEVSSLPNNLVCGLGVYQ